MQIVKSVLMTSVVRYAIIDSCFSTDNLKGAIMKLNIRRYNMKDMYNNDLVVTNNSSFSAPMVSAIDGNRLIDNIFNGKNTPYLVAGVVSIVGIVGYVAIKSMQHKYSVSIEKGETSVSVAPQNN